MASLRLESQFVPFIKFLKCFQIKVRPGFTISRFLSRQPGRMYLPSFQNAPRVSTLFLFPNHKAARIPIFTQDAQSLQKHFPLLDLLLDALIEYSFDGSYPVHHFQTNIWSIQMHEPGFEPLLGQTGPETSQSRTVSLFCGGFILYSPVHQLESLKFQILFFLDFPSVVYLFGLLQRERMFQSKGIFPIFLGNDSLNAVFLEYSPFFVLILVLKCIFSNCFYGYLWLGREFRLNVRVWEVLFRKFELGPWDGYFILLLG